MLELLLAGMLLQASGELQDPYDSSLSQEATELVQARQDIRQEDFIARLEALGRNGDAAAFALMRSYFRSAAIDPNGKRAFDRAYLFDIRKWAAIAAEQDPDPKKRNDAAEILTSLKD